VVSPSYSHGQAWVSEFPDRRPGADTRYHQISRACLREARWPGSACCHWRRLCCPDSSGLVQPAWARSWLTRRAAHFPALPPVAALVTMAELARLRRQLPLEPSRPRAAFVLAWGANASALLLFHLVANGGPAERVSINGAGAHDQADRSARNRSLRLGLSGQGQMMDGGTRTGLPSCSITPRPWDLCRTCPSSSPKASFF
jgi:hypothetical protein